MKMYPSEKFFERSSVDNIRLKVKEKPIINFSTRNFKIMVIPQENIKSYFRNVFFGG